MKKTLLILGIGAVVGAVTYSVWQSMKKQKPTVVVSTDKKNEDIPAAVPVSAPVPVPVQNVPVDDVDFAKKAAEASITERHEEAAQIIKDAVEVICKQSASSDGELEELDQIASGLDNLLKED